MVAVSGDMASCRGKEGKMASPLKKSALQQMTVVFFAAVYMVAVSRYLASCRGKEGKMDGMGKSALH